MFLPYRLLAIELKRNGWMKPFLQYQKALEKHLKNSLRIEFLTKCKLAEIIPKFLKFRIPTNGCFDNNTVHKFQQNCYGKKLHMQKLI